MWRDSQSPARSPGPALESPSPVSPQEWYPLTPTFSLLGRPPGPSHRHCHPGRGDHETQEAALQHLCHAHQTEPADDQVGYGEILLHEPHGGPGVLHLRQSSNSLSLGWWEWVWADAEGGSGGNGSSRTCPSKHLRAGPYPHPLKESRGAICQPCLPPATEAWGALEELWI